MIKVIILHPPLYPANIEFFNELGKFVDLTIIIFGERPKNHPMWDINSFITGYETFKIKIIGRGVTRWGIFANPSFLRYIIREKPHIILSIAFWLPTFYVSMLKKIVDYKVIILSNVTEYDEVNKSYLRFIYRKFIANLVDGFIAASPHTVKYLKTILPSSKYRNINLSIQTINSEKYRNSYDTLPAKENLRDKWGFDLERIILIGVGRIVKIKKWDTVLRTLRNIDNHIIFVLVGNGEQAELDLLKHLAYKLNVNDRFVTMGRKEEHELMELYKLSDALILPSVSEPFGFVVPEALNMGLPVLCSKYAGASCLIKDGFNGYIIDPYRDYSHLLKETLEDLDRMNSNALSSCNEYDIIKRSKEFVDIIEKYNDQ